MENAGCKQNESSFCSIPIDSAGRGSGYDEPHQRNARPCSVPRSDGKSYPDRIIINKIAEKVNCCLGFLEKYFLCI